MNVQYKKNRVSFVYNPSWLIAMAHEPPPALVGPFERCEGCPYPGHGFIIWGKERCLRTDVKEIMERSNQTFGGQTS